MGERTRPVEILIVEDNLGDVRLTEEALREGEIESRLTVARDGIEALDLLKKRNGYENATTPDLILLDLNLPRMDGGELLEKIKKDDGLSSIPVVVLTTSESVEDVSRMYKLHAACYITKPVDFEQFTKVVSAIENFWFSVVTLPGKI